MTRKKEFEVEQIGDHVRIVRCFFRGGRVEIPGTLEGCRVTEIAPYAFSAHGACPEEGALCGSQLLEIYLPETIERIGKYAFYGCEQLEHISFYSNVKDIGAGAFTGCHRVRKLDVTIVEGTRSCLRELLLELHEKQVVQYHSNQGEARLIFPEFFEEAVENTPARILETHTHGSGMLYRNCFVQTELQFSLYDKRFPWAIENEQREDVFAIAFGRLCYPLALQQEAKEKYIQFLHQYVREAAAWAVKKSDGVKMIQLLTEEVVQSKEELASLIQISEQAKQIELVSYLMDVQHKRYPIAMTVSDRFEL